MKTKNRVLGIVYVIMLLVLAFTLVACNSSDDKSGENGKSAYEIAVENGFDGTVEEWLASLKGEQGQIGSDGKSGENGKSAYEIAVENGFDGTVEEWLASLKGEQGQIGSGINDATVRIDNEGKITIGGLNSGLTIYDTTKLSFAQTEESLSGILSISVFNPQNAFDTIRYSIYRNGAVIADTEYVDYICENVEITDGEVLAFIDAPYFGKYNVKIEFLKDDVVKFNVGKEIAFTASHYNFIYSNSTMPVLYSAVELVKLDHKYPTYVAINRSSTFDWYNLPENTYAIPNSTFKTGTTKLALYNEDNQEKTCEYGALVNGTWGEIYANNSTVTVALKQMKYWIGELYNLDNTSTFSFYVDDVVTPVPLWWAYGNNISTSNFDITMYTEGTATSSYFVKNGLATKAGYDALRASYDTFVEWLKAGNDITSIWSSEYAVPMAMDSNIEYVVNTKASMLAALDTTDANYAEYSEMLNSNMVQYTIGDALESVADCGKTSDLEFLLRTRWIDSDGEEGSANGYFSTNNGKKNLLIIGTSVTGENNSNGCGENTTLMSFLPYIVSTYGSEYNIFYKGHPSYPINRFEDGRQEYFEENGIVVLPNAVPAETYMYLYDEVYICGYYSSTMVSSKIGQTIFFIGQEANIKNQAATAAMFDETSDNYLGVFENTVFINTDSIAE